MTPLLDPQVFSRFESFDEFFRKSSVFSAAIHTEKRDSFTRLKGKPNL